VATLVTALAVIAAAVSFLPAARFQLMSPAAGAMALAARGVTEILASYLVAQRFARTASALNFGIAVGLGVMAVGHVSFVVTRATYAPDGGAAAVLPYQLAGAAVLAAAALTRRRTLPRRSRGSLVVVGVAALTLVLVLLAAVGAIPSVEAPLGADEHEAVPFRIAIGVLYTVAALALLANRDARREPFTRWLTVAMCLATLAQLERVAEPVSMLGMFTWMHVFLLGFTLALLTGSLGQIRDDQRRLAEVAVVDERRRMARDIHDGLAQEVAFIASQSKYLAVESGDRRLDEIAVAAERALDDSRAVVGALRRPSGAPLSASIAQQAQEFARRWGLRIELSLEPEVAVSPEKEQAILRIVGEALSNAARHAHASTVGIRLDQREGPLLVAVSDDGRGFDADIQADRGFGLRGMCERARLVGGDVRLVSEPGRGTRVEIAMP
jgi:signal transduction histidine kinase